MRAVAYSIRSFEKEPLAKANHKKHDITLISNALGLETAEYAAGKEAIIISESDHVSEAVLKRLAELGVKFITVRSTEAGNIDGSCASRMNIQIATVSVPSAVPVNGPEFILYQYEIARGTIHNLDHWQEIRNTSGARPSVITAVNGVPPTT